MSDNNQEIKRGDFAKRKGEIILREHEFDGIQEFDQKLPNWWLWSFYAAILGLFVYWILYYQLRIYQTDEQQTSSAIAAVYDAKEKESQQTLAALDDATLINTWANDPAIIASGETIYNTNCTACHGADLAAVMDVGGTKYPLPGRSLVDGIWEYGGKPNDIIMLVKNGSPAGAKGMNGALMQSWSATLTTKQIAEVTAYIIAKNLKEYNLAP
jgi:cytochrome c oxidase cbb3-type subunit III